jgi:helix-turn-helix, Psq domain
VNLSFPASTVGRPRLLTDRQVEVVLAEHVRFVAWGALRRAVKSQRQLAREYGVSQGTISRAVRSKGNYKQPSPESRAATLAARNAVRRRIR